jgi:hypothetical protein
MKKVILLILKLTVTSLIVVGCSDQTENFTRFEDKSLDVSGGTSGSICEGRSLGDCRELYEYCQPVYRLLDSTLVEGEPNLSTDNLVFEYCYEGDTPVYNRPNTETVIDTSEEISNEGTSNEGTSNEGTNNEGTSNEGTSNEGTNNEGTSNEGTSNEGTSNEGTVSEKEENIRPEKVKEVFICQKIVREDGTVENMTIAVEESKVEEILNQEADSSLGACEKISQKEKHKKKMAFCHVAERSLKEITLYLPRKAIEAHLREHDHDYEGECIGKFEKRSRR